MTTNVKPEIPLSASSLLGEAFHYGPHGLMVEKVPLTKIAQEVGTPSYIYSRRAMTEAFLGFESAFAEAAPELDVTICYAVKANSNLAVIRTLANLGAGADIVSGGELTRALRAGVLPRRVVFSGVGKSRDEIAAALEAGIRQINVESIPELYALSEIASAKDMTAKVAIRVNPDVDANTHEKITTGRKDDKFGIDFDEVLDVYAFARTLPAIEPVGIAAHIGSQLLDLAPCHSAFRRLAMLVHALRDAGHSIERVDLGGGLGITYRDETPPPMVDYARLVNDTIGGLGCHVMIEPGRALVGNAGLLLGKVIYEKINAGRRYIVTDAAMNDLVRPAMYGAWHEIVPVSGPGKSIGPADIVGPICETGDRFATSRPFPKVEEGDLIAMLSAGAYGFVMASRYNTRAMPAEVLVDEDRYAVIRERESIEDILGEETLPTWLA